MSLPEEEPERPLFIKKIPPPPPPAHGGAWKVAYADFVTAMMAFFLLLWLLNATSQDQKIGISNYFEPTGVIQGSSGSGGVFGGISMADQVVEEVPGETHERLVGTDTELQNELDKQSKQSETHNQPKSATPSKSKLEEERFENAKRVFRQALFDLPNLSPLKDSIKVKTTDEGLQIQLLDQTGKPLFEPNSDKLTPLAKKLLLLATKIIKTVPSPITIAGHTDSQPLKGNSNKTNWDLSVDRANSARRQLTQYGVPEKQVESVIGLADKVPLLIKDPNNRQNRRISIVLLREKEETEINVPPQPPRLL